MWPNPQETVDVITFAEAILNGNSIFCAVALSKKGTFLLLLAVASLVIYRLMTQAVITIWKVIAAKLRWKQCLSNWKKIHIRYLLLHGMRWCIAPTFMGVASYWYSKKVISDKTYALAGVKWWNLEKSYDIITC